MTKGTLEIANSKTLPTTGVLTVGSSQSVVSLVRSPVVAANTIQLSSPSSGAETSNSAASPVGKSSEPASVGQNAAAVVPAVSTPVVALPTFTSVGANLAAVVQKTPSIQKQASLDSLRTMLVQETNISPAPKLPVASSRLGVATLGAVKAPNQGQSTGNQPPLAVHAINILPAPQLPAVSPKLAAVALGAVKISNQGLWSLGNQPPLAAVATNSPASLTSLNAVQGAVPAKQAHAVDEAMQSWISASSAKAMPSLDQTETDPSKKPLERTPIEP